MGYLNTDWGDEGHLNCISYSYWSFALGADRAWRNIPDQDAARHFDQRFLAQLLPGAPASWLDVLDLLGNQYQLFARTNGLPNGIHRMLLTGDYERGQEGSLKVRFLYGNEWPFPEGDALAQALNYSKKAQDILELSTGITDELELVRLEWLAGATLGACACRRALAFLGRPEAGAPPLRADYFSQALGQLDAVWRRRNRPSDWPIQCQRMQLLIEQDRLQS